MERFSQRDEKGVAYIRNYFKHTHGLQASEKLAAYEDAEEQGQLAILPTGYMHGRITDKYAKYDAYSIHGICYAGFDDNCNMPHCSGCPIRKMYMIMQDIENQVEDAQTALNK